MILIPVLLILAQAPQQLPPPPPVTTTTTTSGPDEYVLGVGDVINVTIFSEPDASHPNATIDNDGTIDMPLIGRVKAGGRTTRAVEKEVHDRLAEKYLLNPSVSVEIVKYRSKSVMVQGYVRDPGQKILEGNASLTSVLAQAGSMTIDAGSYVIISHRGADGAIEQTRVLRRDIESGQAQNIQLKDGDTVLVPKAATFYVNGQVRTPGSYTWDEGLTVERALTLAGGPTERAGSISIDRGGKTVTKKAKKTDLVQANDTIRVGTRIF
jgi:polysaccharide export outer membrane protein